jgi:hypothetical protein
VPGCLHCARRFYSAASPYYIIASNPGNRRSAIAASSPVTIHAKDSPHRLHVIGLQFQFIPPYPAHRLVLGACAANVTSPCQDPGIPRRGATPYQPSRPIFPIGKLLRRHPNRMADGYINPDSAPGLPLSTWVSITNKNPTLPSSQWIPSRIVCQGILLHTHMSRSQRRRPRRRPRLSHRSKPFLHRLPKNCIPFPSHLDLSTRAIHCRLATRALQISSLRK